MESSVVNAVGIWFHSVSTGRYLYLMRNDPKHPGNWGLPGGRIESGESLRDAMFRECQEELGFVPDFLRLVPIEKFTTSDNKFCYHTFYCSVDNEFVPLLNHEHMGYAWIDSGQFPKPLHPGLWSTINLDAVRNKIQTVEQQTKLTS